MSSEEEVVPPQKKVDRRRGPRLSEADIRAKVEAELRESIEAQVRAEMAEAALKAVDDGPMFNTEVDLQAKDAVTIHFVEDGMTLLGNVWVRGQELTVKPGTPEWEACPKKNGKIILLMDEDEQIARWGKRMFRQGPWRGLDFDLSDPNLSDQDREKLLTIQKKRQERAPFSPPVR